MTNIIRLPTPDADGSIRAAVAVADLLARAESLLLTAGVIARSGRLKAACAQSQDAVLRARHIAEESLT